MNHDVANNLKAAAVVVVLVAVAVVCSYALPEPVSAIRLLWP